jgi:hypothetical protein
MESLQRVRLSKSQACTIDILQQTIKCVLFDNVQDAIQVKKGLEQQFKPTEQCFNVIHICGAIP